jgi:hypothetical protein
MLSTIPQQVSNQNVLPESVVFGSSPALGILGNLVKECKRTEWDKQTQALISFLSSYTKNGI